MNQTQIILITGAAGFLGKNLCTHLACRKDIDLRCHDLANSKEELERHVAEAGTIFHLAGVNRPKNPDEFEAGNAGFTAELLGMIRKANRKPHIVLSSSVQAELDNPYGKSKRNAEEMLEQAAKSGEIELSIFRLLNLFGKWSRPNYNAVTSTFCHNIANDLPIQISDPNHEIRLAYIDDVVEAFVKEIDEKPVRTGFLVEPDAIPFINITLGALADRIRCYRNMQETLMIPDLSDRFNQQLYATYLSYVPKERWEYGPKINTDDRGNLAELVKSQYFGQMFVSKTKPGITRGNHYHHTKTEKFIVISGEALIRFRHIAGDEVLEFPVRGEDYRIVDIPPGYTHNITNTGSTELITLFWASEIFDAGHTDTCYIAV